jgi:hypothetical protein
VIDPRGMTLLDWADSVILVVNDAWAFGRLTDENDWQNWGIGFLRASPFSQRVVPDPHQFADWREWAMRVYPLLEGTD